MSPSFMGKGLRNAATFADGFIVLEGDVPKRSDRPLRWVMVLRRIWPWLGWSQGNVDALVSGVVNLGFGVVDQDL